MTPQEVRRARWLRAAPWVLGLLAVGVALFATVRGPGVGPDSCHYLSMAENIAAGRGIVTSITGFSRDGDTAPLSGWPPLYPATIAALRFAGIPLELAARLVGALGFGALVLLTSLAAREVENELAGATRRAFLPPHVLAVMLCLTWVPILYRATWALSDVPFVCLAMLSVYACIRAERAGAAAARWAALAAAAAALSSLTRYLGAATVLSFGGWLWWRARRARLLSLRTAIALAALAAAPLALWFVRNAVLTDRLLYGHAPRSPEGVPLEVFREIRTAAGDVLPWASVLTRALRLEAPFPWEHAAAVVAALALGVLVCLPGFRAGRVVALTRSSPSARLLGVFAAVYLVGAAVGVRLSHVGTMEARYVAAAYPWLLAALVPMAWPALAARPLIRLPFHAVARCLFLLWASYLLGTAAVCVSVTRGGNGFSASRERDRWGLEGRASSEFLRGTDYPRVISDNDVGAWYLTRKPTKLLPGVGDRAGMRSLVEEPRHALLVVYRGGSHWSPHSASIEELEAEGIRRHWRTVASFPDCEVLARDDG